MHRTADLESREVDSAGWEGCRARAGRPGTGRQKKTRAQTPWDLRPLTRGGSWRELVHRNRTGQLQMEKRGTHHIRVALSLEKTSCLPCF